MTPNDRVVFDCNIFFQAVLNPTGPARRCFDEAAGNRFKLVYDSHVLSEFSEVTSRQKLLRKYPQLTDGRVEELLDLTRLIGESHENVPAIYRLVRDNDDAHYIDLAIATSAICVVSRDNDLLTLRDPSHPDGREFLARYPNLLILDPVAFLQSLETPIP